MNRYEERQAPAWWVWAVWLGAALFVGWAVAQTRHGWAAVAGYAIPIALVAAWLGQGSRRRVVVDGDALRMGRFELPLREIIGVRPLDSKRTARHASARGANFGVVNFVPWWLSSSVMVNTSRAGTPAHPSTYVIGTRRPGELARAITEAATASGSALMPESDVAPRPALEAIGSGSRFRVSWFVQIPGMVFLVGGIVSAVAGFALWRHDHVLDQRGVRTQAQVLADHDHKVRVEFPLPGGRNQFAKFEVSGGDFAPGRTIDVVYDPRHPSHVRPRNHANPAYVVPVVGAVVLVVLGALYLWFLNRRPRLQRSELGFSTG